MRHDSSIPLELHAGARESIKDALGMFWSSIYGDQDLVDADIDSRVLAASQLYIDIMEALSLRDHNGLPVFHREHWQPVMIRLSERNTGCGLLVNMEDKAVIGSQTQALNPGHVYLEGEVFEVGGNAVYSKVYTYPFSAAGGCRMVGVKTCLCDSISSPKHLLSADRDFSISGDTLIIRKEKDPFESGDYRVIDDKGDKIAVLWACDAAIDTNNVGDFLSYPLGLDVPTTEASARMISALWDVVVFGVTPRYLNTVLGAIFGIDTISEDTIVESVSDADSAGYVTVVTGEGVYKELGSVLNPAIVVGASLPAGTMLTNEVTVYHGLSIDEIEALTESFLTNLALPPGSVLGVEDTVVLESVDSTLQSGGWFKLNSCDTASSPFWTAVFSRTTEDERNALFSALVNGGTAEEPTVNPLKALGYVTLANLILVTTTRALDSDPSSGIVLNALTRLIPASAAMLTVQFDNTDESVSVPEEDLSFINNVETQSENAAEAEDDVTFTFVPCAETEV